MPTLGLVHTVYRVIPSLADLAAELLPDLDVAHYLDESVLREAITAGGLTPAIVRRVCQLVLLAAESSNLVLVTCSSVGPAAELAAAMTATPVLRIDRPMAEAAVAASEVVGVIATLGSTLKPTADLVARCAAEAGRQVAVREMLCEGAFEAAGRGDTAEHDRRVLAGLRGLLTGSDAVDMVLLAQASMARVAEQLPTEQQARVLSSPRSGLQRAGKTLRELS